MDSFDLTTQPWIPCEFLDGRFVELSTRDTLIEAQRIRAIVDPSPLVLAVLHRHLLAVLHRSYDGPKTMPAWATIAQGRRFEAARVETYLESVRGRMDLFHPTHPFAQTRGLAHQFRADPIDELTLERSGWGSGRALFQHRPAGHSLSMKPGEAVRALLAHQAFATGGLVRKPNEPTSATGAPLLRAGVVLLRGKSLFRTLISNLLIYDTAQGNPVTGDEDDAPAWEQNPLAATLRSKQEPKRLPSGWLDMLTWISRRIELIQEESQVVRFVRCVGQGLAEESPLEPMVAYRRDEKRGFLSIGIDPEKAFWRNADALFESTEGGRRRFQRPRAFAQLAEPDVSAILGPSCVYGIDVLGLSAEKSRVDLTRGEHLDASVGLFADPDAREAVEHVIQLSESAVQCLSRALYTFAQHMLPMADSDGREQKEDRRNFVRALGAEPTAWSALGGAFEQFLRELADDIDAARNSLEGRLIRICRKQFQEAISGAMADGHAIKARALAETALEQGLARVASTDIGATDSTGSEETHG